MLITLARKPQNNQIKLSPEFNNKKNNDTNKYTIYLTCDDGDLTGTSNCYRICKSMKVPASFFMLGWHVCRSNYPNESKYKII